MAVERDETAGVRPGDELLSLLVADQEFAIDIMAVREIRGWSGSTALPGSPAYIRGVVNLRGAVLPILDLPMRLGIQGDEPSATSVVIVVETAGQLIGLLVQGVCDILTVDEGMLQPVPNVGAEPSENVVMGLLTIDQKIISILNLKHVTPELALQDSLAA